MGRWLLPFLLVLVIFSPWLRAGAGWPAMVVERLDHCPTAACDFVQFYLPQARQLFDDPGTMLTGWVYPPLLAILLQGFTLFSDAVATRAWIAINLALIGALGWMCYRRRSPGVLGGVLSVGPVSVSLPVLHALKWGQVSLLVVVLALAGLTRGGRWGATAVGLAAAIKVCPAVLLLLSARGPRRRDDSWSCPRSALGLVMPPGWHHYFVFLPFAQACALSSPGAPRGLAVASALLCAAPILALPYAPDVYFLWSKWGGTTVAALLAWGALVSLGHAEPPIERA